MPKPIFTELKQSMAKIYLIGVFLVALCATLASVSAQATGSQGIYRLAVFGDSLSAGYQLPEEAGFPKVLELALRKAGHRVDVINASVSGDTSTGGLARIDWALNGKIDGVIVELGANDMLRGIEPEKTRDALDKIISRIKAKGAQVLLAGMIAAPGMGTHYESRFNAIYKELAEKHQIILMPFFLNGVAGNKKLNLPDSMHPNPEGVRLMVRNILPQVEKLIAGKNVSR